MKKNIGYSIILLALIGVAAPILGQDYVSFMKWWLTLLILGIVFLPTTRQLFSKFSDKGYLFSKVIGLSFGGYLLWLFSSIKVLKFTAFNGYLCLAFLVVLNALLFRKQLKDSKEGVALKSTEFNDVLSWALIEEVLFFAILLGCCYIKGFKPQAYGTEKFMDYGFMSSMMRSDYMPPYDLWFVGGKINYYYLGQYLATYLTKMSRVTVNVGYNLMLTTIATMTALLPASIVFNLAQRKLEQRRTKLMAPKKRDKAVPYLAGLLAGVLVSCSANMHFVIFKWVVPFLYKALDIDADYSYWFPNSTRYIGYVPDTNDKTIHEFPSYSSILGDLHAHYINLIFVLTVIALLLSWLIGQQQKKNIKDTLSGKNYKAYIREICNPCILMITFFIGLFHTTNYWDYPIYFVVSGAIILFSNAVTYQFKKNTWIVTMFQGILVLVGGSIVALPFTINFDQISTQIRVATNHTPFYQLVVLWGLPVVIGIGYLVSCINEYRLEKEKALGKVNEITDKKNVFQKAWIGFKKFHESLDYTDMFIILLVLCACGLVLMPELIYVKDIYEGDYKRANTMFKLTYQAFLLFSICSGYILVKLLAWGNNKHQRKVASVGLILSMLTSFYVVHSTKAWFGDVTKTENRQSLDAESFMDTTMPEDAQAIDWLNANVKGHAVVLEAPGDSYSDYERISVFTGLQTVSGWYVHEWLWRSGHDEIDERNADIETIYTSTDQTTVESLVEKYGLDYIYVGNLERSKYTNPVNDDLLKSLGEVVFTCPSTTEGGNESYLVQIK